MQKSRLRIAFLFFIFAFDNKFSTLRKTKKSRRKTRLLHLLVDFTDKFSNSLIQELQILSGLKSYLSAL